MQAAGMPPHPVEYSTQYMHVGVGACNARKIFLRFWVVFSDDTDHKVIKDNGVSGSNVSPRAAIGSVQYTVLCRESHRLGARRDYLLQSRYDTQAFDRSSFNLNRNEIEA